MIEIGEISEIQMSYEEAVMYCFSIGDGWRLPSWDEYMYDITYNRIEHDDMIDTWYAEDSERNDYHKCHVLPVRDAKND